MKYNVAQLLKEAIGSHRNFDIEEDICDADHPVEYVRGSVEMVRTHQGIWVQARLDVRTPQDCSRCLEGFSRTFGIELDEEYFPEIDVKTGARVSLPRTGRCCSSAQTTTWIWQKPPAKPRWPLFP